ncbi:MAG: right-handed parallel beta-helix repeat-containing protein, partial [Patescibacteria group bacterium]
DNLPYIALAGEMSPYEYRILERRANTITASSIISVYGNGSSQWALGNSGEELVLSYASTTLDKSPAITGDTWTAGENTSSTTRKTMERVDSKQSGATSTNWTTWGTNINFIKNGQDADGNQISGTPGECNSASYSNLNNDQSITGDLTLTKNDCYYTSAGSSVSATGTLAIEEGVRISLYQNNLVINGVIVASGTPNNPIIIDSFSGMQTSNSVKISGSNGTSTMDNVIISNTGGIYLNNSASLEISNAEFTNNRYGVELNNNSSVVIGNANFASTTREALSAYNGSSISVSSSTISNTIDGDAIGIYDSNLTISSTTIDIVLEGDGIGAYDSTVSIASSTVSNVLDGDGIGLYDSTTTISNVVVENVSGDGIAVYGGSISGTATIDGVGVEF